MYELYNYCQCTEFEFQLHILINLIFTYVNPIPCGHVYKQRGGYWPYTYSQGMVLSMVCVSSSCPWLIIVRQGISTLYAVVYTCWLNFMVWISGGFACYEISSWPCILNNRVSFVRKSIVDHVCWHSSLSSVIDLHGPKTLLSVMFFSNSATHAITNIILVGLLTKSTIAFIS